VFSSSAESTWHPDTPSPTSQRQRYTQAFERPPRGPRNRLAPRTNQGALRRPALRATAPRPISRPAHGLIRHRARQGQSSAPHQRAHRDTRIVPATRRYRASLYTRFAHLYNHIPVHTLLFVISVHNTYNSISVYIFSNNKIRLCFC